MKAGKDNDDDDDGSGLLMLINCYQWLLMVINGWWWLLLLLCWCFSSSYDGERSSNFWGVTCNCEDHRLQGQTFLTNGTWQTVPLPGSPENRKLLYCVCLYPLEKSVGLKSMSEPVHDRTCLILLDPKNGSNMFKLNSLWQIPWCFFSHLAPEDSAGIQTNLTTGKVRRIQRLQTLGGNGMTLSLTYVVYIMDM